MAVAASPGAASGTRRRRKVPARVRPSIMPASSISFGISAKKPRITQTTSDRLKVECARITASGVSVMPSIVNSRNIGTTTEIGGAMRVVRKKKKQILLAGEVPAREQIGGRDADQQRKRGARDRDQDAVADQGQIALVQEHRRIVLEGRVEDPDRHRGQRIEAALERGQDDPEVGRQRHHQHREDQGPGEAAPGAAHRDAPEAALGAAGRGPRPSVQVIAL